MLRANGLKPVFCLEAKIDGFQYGEFLHAFNDWTLTKKGPPIEKCLGPTDWERSWEDNCFYRSKFYVEYRKMRCGKTLQRWCNFETLGRKHSSGLFYTAKGPAKFVWEVWACYSYSNRRTPLKHRLQLFLSSGVVHMSTGGNELSVKEPPHHKRNFAFGSSRGKACLAKFLNENLAKIK